MAKVLTFAPREAKAEKSFADRVRMLAEELNRLAANIDAGGVGYEECIVLFSDPESGDVMYDSNLDDQYRIAGILLRAANHAANGDE